MEQARGRLAYPPGGMLPDSQRLSCPCSLSRAADLAEEELQRATARCHDLEEALEAELEATRCAREALHDRG